MPLSEVERGCDKIVSPRVPGALKGSDVTQIQAPNKEKKKRKEKEKRG